MFRATVYEISRLEPANKGDMSAWYGRDISDIPHRGPDCGEFLE
jgi:hypothetical protein